eukprot:jgi/Botrbrau1/3182/Bobra.37_2s0012.1
MWKMGLEKGLALVFSVGLLSRDVSRISEIRDLKQMQKGGLRGLIPKAMLYPTSFWNQACFLTMYGLVGLRQTLAAVCYGSLALALLNTLTFHLLLSYTYLVPNQDIATMSVMAHAFVSMLLAGFVVNLNHMHKVLLWFTYPFPARYAMQIVMNMQVKGTPQESLLKFWGMTWSVPANFAGLSILSFLCAILGYVAILTLKYRRQIRR